MTLREHQYTDKMNVSYLHNMKFTQFIESLLPQVICNVSFDRQYILKVKGPENHGKCGKIGLNNKSICKSQKRDGTRCPGW